MPCKTPFSLLPAALLAAGCASGGPAPTSDPVLGFGLHAVDSARYHVANSTRMSVATPMGDIAVRDASEATLDLAFAAEAGRTKVTAEVTSFEAETENDMTGTQTAANDDVDGPLVFAVNDRGAVEVLSLPETSGIAGERARFTAMAHAIFPRLPNRAATTGLSWTDTVTWSADSDGNVLVTTAYRYSLAGDTVANGRRLASIAVSGESAVTIKAVESGMAMTTALEGSETGFALWDLERGILHSLVLDQELEGSVELAMGGVQDMPVEFSARWEVQLDQGGSGSP